MRLVDGVTDVGLLLRRSKRDCIMGYIVRACSCQGFEGGPRVVSVFEAQVPGDGEAQIRAAVLTGLVTYLQPRPLRHMHGRRLRRLRRGCGKPA